MQRSKPILFLDDCPLCGARNRIEHNPDKEYVFIMEENTIHATRIRCQGCNRAVVHLQLPTGERLLWGLEDEFIKDECFLKKTSDFPGIFSKTTIFYTYSPFLFERQSTMDSIRKYLKDNRVGMGRIILIDWEFCPKSWEIHPELMEMCHDVVLLPIEIYAGTNQRMTPSLWAERIIKRLSMQFMESTIISAYPKLLEDSLKIDKNGIDEWTEDDKKEIARKWFERKSVKEHYIGVSMHVRKKSHH